MEVSMKIEYNWKCDQDIEIPEIHLEVLKDDAEVHIFEMIKERYQGELNKC